MDDDRLIDIETKLAHQEHLVEGLNRVVTDQQARIGRLEQACRSLAERLKSVADGAPGGPAGDERPPHY